MLGRAWGRHGEVFAVSLSGGAERFQDLQEVFLFDAPGAPGERPIGLEAVWEHRGGLIFKFRGVDSISEAEALKGAEVRIPLEARRKLSEGEYFQSDLLGCEVVERASGERLGVVTAWKEYGGPQLLEVTGQGEPLLIPFARSICVEIDIAGRRILVDLPEGLKDLGAPLKRKAPESTE